MSYPADFKEITGFNCEDNNYYLLHNASNLYAFHRFGTPLIQSQTLLKLFSSSQRFELVCVSYFGTPLMQAQTVSRSFTNIFFYWATNSIVFAKVA